MALSNAGWLIPFACLGLVALTTARPEPQAPPPHGDRIVVDARGKEVHIDLPFRGSVLTRGTEIPAYLEDTGEPDTLLAVTARRMGDRVRNHIVGDIFPQIVENPRIWASAGISDTEGPKVEIERLMLFDPGVFMGWYTLAEPVERVGLPFVGFRDFPTDESGLWLATRAFAGVVGNPARGDAIVAYEQNLDRELDRELAADARMRRPSYLYILTRPTDRSVVVLGARNHYTRFFAPHAGVVNGCTCDNFYELVDAEHVVADDPDFIVLAPQPGEELPDEFVKDPRWVGLTATINRRVYRAPPGIDYFIASPFWSRWLAELVHPDRVQPKSRELYRDYIQWLLHYRLSDAQLDIAFAVKDNRNMTDASRIESQGAR